MRFHHAILLLLGAIVLGAMLLLAPDHGSPPAGRTASPGKAGEAQGGANPPGSIPEGGPHEAATAVSAADHEPDAPRRRNEFGQPLPFRETAFDAATADLLRQGQRGNRVSLHLFPGLDISVRITGRWDDEGSIRVAAALEGRPAHDRLFMEWNEEGARGLVEIPSENLACEIVRTEDGRYVVREWLFTDVQCGTPVAGGLGAGRGLPAPWLADSDPGGPVFIEPGQVPILNSRPAATPVIYLDFDGEVVSGTAWAGGATINAPPARMNASQIIEVFERVQRDFEGFDVNITTELTVYLAAPADRRTHCVITANDAAAPGSGGVAYLHSFTSGSASFKICWVFSDTSAKSCAEALSHEVGHTLGLSHDGRIAWDGFPREEYYAGHGSGATGWAPIMGVGYTRQLTQWSRGEYFRANNPEDDLAIMGHASRIPPLADDHGSTLASATAVTGDRIEGNIGPGGDADCFSITLSPGDHTINAQPSAHSNLDILLEVLDAEGNLITSDNPPAALAASAFFSLGSTQAVYLRVSGTGKDPVLGDGYPSYGCLGLYGLDGFGSQEQPPAPPIGVSTLSISGSRLRVSWTPNPSATAYQVYRNGALLATVEVTEFLDTTITPSTEYTYTIVALNGFGASSPSAASVIHSPAFDAFIMDGTPDFPGYLVSNPGMTIYAAVRGTKLYVATWSPGNWGSGFNNDHHIFVSDTLLPSATAPAPWAKRGQTAVPEEKPYLAGESQTDYAGWANTEGTTVLFKAPANSGVLEGVIDLAACFGHVPQNVYVAAVAYETEDADVSPPHSGRINAQAPAGNDNDDLEPDEFLQIPVRSVADARMNGIYDALDPARNFRPMTPDFSGEGFPIVRWPVIPLKTYRVFHRPTLSSGAWTQVHSETAGQHDWELSFTHPDGQEASGFYRVTQP